MWADVASSQVKYNSKSISKTASKKIVYKNFKHIGLKLEYQQILV